MNIEQDQAVSNSPSKSSQELQQESLLALVSVRPPTPDKCAVCLNNKQLDIIARIDSCSHTFCFSCIIEWSKVRAICPLCKQPFNLITRERYSGDIVEEVRVQTTREATSTAFTNLNDVIHWIDQTRTRSHRFNNRSRGDLFRQMVYVEWLNEIPAIVHRPNISARNASLSPLSRPEDSSLSSWSNLISLNSIRRLLHRYLNQTTDDLRQSTIHSQSTRQTVAFRKYVYLNHLFVRSPLIGQHHDTLTVRECSPTWYAANPACLHRLVPFLARELFALLRNDERTIERIVQEILSTIQRHEIRSHAMKRKLSDYLGRYTKQFIHEFHTFASCPYDLAGFDRHAQYPHVNASRQPPSLSPIQLDDEDGDEQSPIILDETPDLSIATSDLPASSSSSSRTMAATEPRSTSPECEIVQYVHATHDRSPTLIVLSEDDDEEDEDESEDDDVEVHVASSSKRKQGPHRHHQAKQLKMQPRTPGQLIDSSQASSHHLHSSVSDDTRTTSIILDDDDDDEQQTEINVHE